MVPGECERGEGEESEQGYWRSESGSDGGVCGGTIAGSSAEGREGGSKDYDGAEEDDAEVAGEDGEGFEVFHL